MAGVDLKTVQELMGHKTIAMTGPVRPSRADAQVEGVRNARSPRFDFGTTWPQNGYWSKNAAREHEAGYLSS
jgi:hypothetical protein